MVQVVKSVKVWCQSFVAAALLTSASTGFAMNPEDEAKVDARFLQGIDDLKDEKLKSAIETFSSILNENPGLHRAKLELALAYYRSLRYAKAEKLANEVLDDSLTPPEVRVTILAFLAQVKRDTEKYGRGSKWTPSISLGLMHDTNVNVGPNNDLIRPGDVDTGTISLTPASFKQADNASVVTAGIDHIFQSGRQVEWGEATGMLVWQTGLNGYARTYYHEKDFNLGVVSFSTGPGMLLLNHWRASLLFKSDYLSLGNHTLGWFNSLVPSVTWQMINSEVTWDAIFTHREYDREEDRGREGNYFSSGFSAGRYFDNRRVVATAGGRFSKLRTRDESFGYFSTQFDVGLSIDTWPNGSVFGTGRITDYAYSGNAPGFSEKRREQEYKVTFGLQHEFKEEQDLLRNWAVTLFFEYNRNDSNVNVVGINLYD